jgi:ElaB/YqjD/DUF883 family membrane-anchored ribosome-binding protein
MTPEGPDEADEESNRVARGFEALVDEEALFPGTPALTKPAVAAPADAAATPPGDGTGDMFAPPSTADRSALDGRLDQLEERVRETMDRLREVIEAQVPGAVEGLRADLETLRLELQTALEVATAQLAEERKELRSQIATTVGAANRWFVRTRDQLYERLDHIAQVAREAEAAAARAIPGAAPPALDAGPEPPPALERGADVAGTGVEAGPGVEATGEEEIEVEFEVVGPPEAPPAELDGDDRDARRVALDPVPTQLRQLQTEVADLRATVGRIDRRMARSKPVTLDPSQIELIVEALVLAWPSSAPARTRTGTGTRAPAARAAAGEDVAPTRTRKARSTSKAAPAPAKAAAAKKGRATAAKARTGTAQAAAKASKASKSATAAARATRARKAADTAAPRRTTYRTLI